MDSKYESSVSMISRIRGFQESLQPEIIDPTTRVLAINLKQCDLLAVKIYLYNLVYQAAILDLSPDNHDSNVIIIDGQFLFKDSEFAKYANKDPVASSKVCISRPSDESVYLMHLHERLPCSMALNSNLRLVVLISLPMALFPGLIDQLNTCLFSLSISTLVVLVADRFSKPQLDLYRQKSICQTIICKLDAESNQEEPRESHLKCTIPLAILKNESTVIKKSILF